MKKWIINCIKKEKQKDTNLKGKDGKHVNHVQGPHATYVMLYQLQWHMHF